MTNQTEVMKGEVSIFKDIVSKLIPTLSNFRMKTASLVVAITGRKETTFDLPAVSVKLAAIKSATQSKVFVQILPKTV